MIYNKDKLRENIKQRRTRKMKRITINNGTVTEKQAIKEAKEYNEKTGNAVEVCNMIGDTVLYLRKRA